MTGRPKTKARREAQARVKTRFDRVAREAVLKRSEELGSVAAAARGCTACTASAAGRWARGRGG